MFVLDFVYTILEHLVIYSNLDYTVVMPFSTNYYDGFFNYLFDLLESCLAK
jgi:hypothetical protein